MDEVISVCDVVFLVGDSHLEEPLVLVRRNDDRRSFSVIDQYGSLKTYLKTSLYRERGASVPYEKTVLVTRLTNTQFTAYKKQVEQEMRLTSEFGFEESEFRMQLFFPAFHDDSPLVFEDYDGVYWLLMLRREPKQSVTSLGVFAILNDAGEYQLLDFKVCPAATTTLQAIDAEDLPNSFNGIIDGPWKEIPIKIRRSIVAKKYIDSAYKKRFVGSPYWEKQNAKWHAQKLLDSICSFVDQLEMKLQKNELSLSEFHRQRLLLINVLKGMDEDSGKEVKQVVSR